MTVFLVHCCETDVWVTIFHEVKLFPAASQGRWFENCSFEAHLYSLSSEDHVIYGLLLHLRLFNGQSHLLHQLWGRFYPSSMEHWQTCRLPMMRRHHGSRSKAWRSLKFSTFCLGWTFYTQSPYRLLSVEHNWLIRYLTCLLINFWKLHLLRFFKKKLFSMNSL